MIASWGLLAFVKAADTRQNASIAVKLNRKSQYEDFEFEEKVEKRIAPYREPRREYPDYPPQPEQKVRPKDISYNDVDDDDFFSQFNDESDPRRHRR